MKHKTNAMNTLKMFILAIGCATAFPAMAQRYRLGTVKAARHEVTRLLDSRPDSGALRVVAPYRKAVDSIMSPVLGESEVAMTADRPESLLSNFVADVLRDASVRAGKKADIGLCNIGGLRSTMPKGIVTYGDVLEIAPFENHLCVLSLSGKKMKELMEQIALLQRPELYEIDMQKHINIIECRKTILMMLPNVRIYTDFTNSTNTFLYHMSWWELGIRAAYNLLKLPQHIARYQAYSSQVDAEEARTFAQAIGVMAQVRISHANLIATKERFDINDKVYKTYNDNLKWAVANQKITGELSRLELDHMRLETAETEIDRLMTLGNYYVAYYRILNSIGVRHIDAKSLGELRNELAQAKVRAAEELEKARRTYDEDRAKRVAANTNLQNLTELETTIVNQPLTKFNDVDFIAIYDATPEKANSMLNEKR